MKLPGKFEIVHMAMIVYSIAIMLILFLLYEPFKSFIERETVRFWIEAIIYGLMLFLAIVTPITSCAEAMQKARDVTDKYRKKLWFAIVYFIGMTFLAYPMLAHAIITVIQSGLDLVQFKESVNLVLGYRNIEPNSLYVMACFVYGGAAAMLLAFVTIIGVKFVVIWGWRQIIKLVVPLPEEKKEL